MTKYIVNGKVIFTTTTNTCSKPHDYLRDLLIDAQLAGQKVEIVQE